MTLTQILRTARQNLVLYLVSSLVICAVGIAAVVIEYLDYQSKTVGISNSASKYTEQVKYAFEYNEADKINIAYLQDQKNPTVDQLSYIVDALQTDQVCREAWATLTDQEKDQMAEIRNSADGKPTYSMLQPNYSKNGDNYCQMPVSVSDTEFVITLSANTTDEVTTHKLFEYINQKFKDLPKKFDPKVTQKNYSKQNTTSSNNLRDPQFSAQIAFILLFAFIFGLCITSSVDYFRRKSATRK
jgi:hypothetical protein